ncbi:hypothetical protein ACHHYP_01969 [Achlya hypogyna]|uniref:Transmembrane protein n=1 Tax=Achlya hypogyna TaxID=1202772 RepID=A0A1V9Z7L6_ACHHY|nr:hypothetical protein ACHHYP_01969 [Achlya hypogyna]
MYSAEWVDRLPRCIYAPRLIDMSAVDVPQTKDGIERLADNEIMRLILAKQHGYLILCPIALLLSFVAIAYSPEWLQPVLSLLPLYFVFRYFMQKRANALIEDEKEQWEEWKEATLYGHIERPAAYAS